MTFSQKLIALRRQSGMSQEEFARCMDVSRQAVSKWESAQSLPDVQRLLAIADHFGVSLDYLLRDDWETDTPGAQAASPSGGEERQVQLVYVQPAYEYISKAHWGSLPLVHVKIRPSGFAVAKGVIAIGNVAVGIVALGGFGLGVLSFGGISAGILALGGIALGCGAIGGVALGGVALGAVSIGVYAAGATVIAQKLGIGAVVQAPAAIAQEARAQEWLPTQNMTRESVRAFLDMHAPHIPTAVRAFLSLLMGR